MSRRALFAAVVLMVVVAAAACGDDDSDSTAEPAPLDLAETPTSETTTTTVATTVAPSNPCELVTHAEAEVIAGTALQDSEPSAESCRYTGPVTGPTAQIEVYVGDGAKKILDINRELGHAIEPLPDVGDEAHLDAGAAFVNVDGTWAAVLVVRLDDPAEYRAALVDALRRVAARL